MEQHRPGDCAIVATLIINEADSRPRWARYRDFVLSILMWLLYLYFIRAALFDLRDLVDETFEWAFAGAGRPSLPAITMFLETLKYYALVVGINGGILIAWALYNKFRFGGRDVRRARPSVTIEDLATLYGVRPEDVASWQEARILVMRHASDGTLTRVMFKETQEAP